MILGVIALYVSSNKGIGQNGETYFDEQKKHIAELSKKSSGTHIYSIMHTSILLVNSRLHHSLTSQST
jgi:hypothetical protein